VRGDVVANDVDDSTEVVVISVTSLEKAGTVFGQLFTCCEEGCGVCGVLDVG
jgi:hypothetical protein